MAGFGSGFGGFGNYNFPTRRGMGEPESAVVQSDGEWAAPWETKLKSMPQTISTLVSRGTELFEGAPNYDAGRAAKGREIAAAEWEQGRQDGHFDFITPESGYKMYGGPMVNPYLSGSPAGYNGFSRVIGDEPVYRTDPNPEYVAFKGQYDNATKQRTEAQTRNQQAYDTMIGGNDAVAGVLPADYADPNFGQITGQAAAAPGTVTSGDNSLTADGTDAVTGAYGGGAGAYNPNPFAFDPTKRGWGGF